jgi:biotin synthase
MRLSLPPHILVRFLARPVPTPVRGHATAAVEYTTPPIRATSAHSQSSSGFRTYSREEISEIYNSPLLPLVYRAAGVHAANHDPTKIQLCTLMNIKSMCQILVKSIRYDMRTHEGLFRCRWWMY